MAFGITYPAWRPILRLSMTCLVILACTAVARGELRLPALFSDHMVLEAGNPAACWGWAAPGDKVEVSFLDVAGKSLGSEQAVADQAGGRWQLKLPVLHSGMSGTLIVKDGGEAKTVHDVITGEVWLASGQSNMTRKIGTPDFPKEVRDTAVKEAADTGDAIRFFTVTQAGADTPRDDVAGKWTVVGPDNVAEISAVAWNFARKLHDTLKVPMGMIVSAYGGTPVESWLSRDALNGTGVSASIWKRHADLMTKLPEETAKYQADLAAWEKRKADAGGKSAEAKPRVPYSETCSRVPVRLFNAMINGLAPFTLKGVIWYQGEENSSRPAEYPELIQALILSWRKLWGDDFPFYYVELANTWHQQKAPSEGGWAFMREAQQAALKLPGTGVATAVDVGNGNIHPWNKKAVGDRLAGLALAGAHGQNIKAESPQFAALAIHGGVARLTFTHAAGLRARRDGTLAGFAIAGSDGLWKWGTARIVGDSIEVSSPDVPSPVAVRYGWASNPILSVENRESLPLRPFRTDTDLP